MASPSVTYTFVNSTTSDADEVNTNFTDLVNSMSDGTKDFSISALTCAGTATLNGAVNLGNASSDDITINGSLAGTVLVKASTSVNIGDATNGLNNVYLEGNDNTIAVQARATLASDYNLILPNSAGTAGYLWMSDGTNQTIVDAVTAKIRFKEGVTQETYVGTDPEVGGSTPFQVVTADRNVMNIAPTVDTVVELPTTSIETGEIWTINFNVSNGDQITIAASNADVITVLGSSAATSTSSGSISLVALQDTPTEDGHWRVTTLLENGTYTPSPTGDIDNLPTGGITVGAPTYYSRVGNVVNVGGRVILNTTSTGLTVFRMSTPIQAIATFGDADIAGVFSIRSGASDENGSIEGGGNNTQAEFRYTAYNATSQTYFYNYIYLLDYQL